MNTLKNEGEKRIDTRKDRPKDVKKAQSTRRGKSIDTSTYQKQGIASGIFCGNITKYCCQS